MCRLARNPVVCTLSHPELLALLVVALALTFAAAMVHPVWDDAWLAMLLDAGGSISSNMKDRPLVGLIWQTLSETSLLWSSGYVIHCGVWFFTAVVGMCIWRAFYPGFAQYSLLIGCLILAPVICKTQMVILTTMLTSHLPVLLVYAAYLLKVYIVRNQATSKRRFFLHATSPALVIFAGLLSEYAVPAAAACAILLFFSLRTLQVPRRQVVLTLAVWFGAVFVSYVAYWLIADPGARDEVRPETVLSHGLMRRLLNAGLVLLTNVWSLVAGNLLNGLASLRIAVSFYGLTVLLIGLIAGLGLIKWTGRQSKCEPLVFQKISPGSSNLAMLAALLIGCLPVVLMRPYGTYAEMGTRFWLPVLPVAASFSIAVALQIIRKRHYWVLSGLVGCLLVQSVAEQVSNMLRVERVTKRCGPVLRQNLSECGITVAEFVFEDRRWIPYDYELTARLTRGWSQGERERFWAHPTLDYTRQAVGGRVWGNQLASTQMQLSIRGVNRNGMVSRVLLVRVQRTGEFDIQSFGLPVHHQ